MSKAAIACLVIACLVMAAAAMAQEEPITRVTVNQVRIDATVTDRKGSPVTNLGSDDFRVFQDRKRQTPIHVQYVAAPEHKAALSPLAASRELKRDEVQRTIVVIIDDADMSAGSFVQSRVAVKRYLDTAMQPGDMVAILCTSRTSSFVSQFTSDPARVRLAIDQISHNPVFRAGWGPLVNTINTTLLALSRMPGRKSLIVFADRLTIPKNGDVSELMDQLRRVVDSSLRSSVRIYGIDPRGLYASPSAPPMMGGVADALKHEGGALTSRAVQVLPRVDPAESQDDTEGLFFLTGETGGLMLEKSNNLTAQLQRALQDQSGYYLIAWNPGGKAFSHPRRRFADYHSIKIEVALPGLKVRSFRGFYGYDRGTSPDLTRSPRAAMQDALLSPFQTGTIDVRLNAQFELARGQPFIRSFANIDGKDIVFTPYPQAGTEACYAMNLEFLTLPEPLDSRVEMLAESQITSLRVCGATHDEIARNGLALTMLHPAPKPGAYQMRLAVRNINGMVAAAAPSLRSPKTLINREPLDTSVGSAHVLVEAPDWHSKPALFSIRVQSAKQPVSVFQPRSVDATDRGMMMGYRTASDGDPAVRRFHPGDKLFFNARIVNVNNPQAQFRIIRTDDAGNETEVHSATAAIASELISGNYQIPDTLEPGAYSLRVTATGTTSAGKPYQSAEEIDFSVLPPSTPQR